MKHWMNFLETLGFETLGQFCQDLSSCWMILIVFEGCLAVFYQFLPRFEQFWYLIVFEECLAIFYQFLPRFEQFFKGV